MKKFNCTVETETTSHCFSFEATDIKSAIERLEKLNLECKDIRELRNDFKGTIRIPEEMYYLNN